MTQDLMIGIDSSTQSCKAIAWTKDGQGIAEGRAPIPLSQPGPGRVEQNPDDWWATCRAALTDLMSQIDASRVAGIAISNQRETVGFFDADGHPACPAIVWLDERCASEVEPFANAIGYQEIHRITGRHPDITPVVYTLAWVKKHQPDIWANCSRILDVHGYLTGKLTGRQVASTTSIDAFCVFDINTMQLSTPILSELGLTGDSFAEILPPGSFVGTVKPQVAAETGLPNSCPVYVAGGDGQCAGLGVHATAPGAVYLNLGTAVITGASSPTALIGPAWRTITSQTGQGYFMESCLRAGTFLVDWLVGNIGGKQTTPEVFAELEKAAQVLPVGSEGVVMSPYLSGCMDPHWDIAARASFHGLRADHGFVHLFRATLEAVTLQSARFVQALRAHDIEPDRLIAVGGGSSNALWTQMLADATGLPLIKCMSREASSLGAAMSAAVGAGWYDSFDAAAEAMVQFGARTNPDPSQAPLWAELSVRQGATYRRE